MGTLLLNTSILVDFPAFVVLCQNRSFISMWYNKKDSLQELVLASLHNMHKMKG